MMMTMSYCVVRPLLSSATIDGYSRHDPPELFPPLEPRDSSIRQATSRFVCSVSLLVVSALTCEWWLILCFKR